MKGSNLPELMLVDEAIQCVVTSNVLDFELEFKFLGILFACLAIEKYLIRNWKFQPSYDYFPIMPTVSKKFIVKFRNKKSEVTTHCRGYHTIFKEASWMNCLNKKIHIKHVTTPPYIFFWGGSGSKGSQ